MEALARAPKIGLFKRREILDVTRQIWREGMTLEPNLAGCGRLSLFRQFEAFTDWDEQCARGARRARPLFLYLFIGLSHHYRHVYRRGLRLGIEFQFNPGQFKMQELINFEPTKSTCDFYLSAEVLNSETLRRHSPESLAKYLQFRRHGYMHDLTHAILARTFVPRNLRNYSTADMAAFLKLQECMVQYLDLVGQQSLGHFSLPLQQMGVLYRPGVPHRDQIDVRDKKVYLRVMTILFRQIFDQDCGRKFSLPTSLRAIEPSVTMNQKFIRSTIPNWSKRINFAALKNQMLPFPAVFSPGGSLSGEEFVTRIRKDRDWALEIYDFMAETFQFFAVNKRLSPKSNLR